MQREKPSAQWTRVRQTGSDWFPRCVGVVGMSDGLGLAEFLADLRAEIARAEVDASGESLKLGVDQIEVSLEITSTLERSGEADGRVKAKFWVLASAEGGVKGSVTSGRNRTQQLKLTLTPRVEETIADASGRTRVTSRGVDVDGELEAGEENPVLPRFPRAH